MIEFQATERNGIPVTHAYMNVGEAVATFAGRLYQGDSGKWMVEPSRFTAEQMAEGQFDDQDSARKYVEKCLKEMSVQTTEQDVNAAKKMMKGMGDTSKSVLEQRRGEPRPFVTPAPKPGKRMRVSKAAAEADDVPAPRKARKTLPPVEKKAVAKGLIQKEGRAVGSADYKVKLAERKDRTCAGCGTVEPGQSVHQVYAKGWRGGKPGGWDAPLCGSCRAKVS